MATQTIAKKVNTLSQKVEMLRSLVISVIGESDPEGEYRPEFVKKILKAAQTKKSGVKFTTGADLLKRIS